MSLLPLAFLGLDEFASRTGWLLSPGLLLPVLRSASPGFNFSFFFFLPSFLRPSRGDVHVCHRPDYFSLPFLMEDQQ